MCILLNRVYDSTIEVVWLDWKANRQMCRFGYNQLLLHALVGLPGLRWGHLYEGVCWRLAVAQLGSIIHTSSIDQFLPRKNVWVPTTACTNTFQRYIEKKRCIRDETPSPFVTLRSHRRRCCQTIISHSIKCWPNTSRAKTALLESRIRQASAMPTMPAVHMNLVFKTKYLLRRCTLDFNANFPSLVGPASYCQCSSLASLKPAIGCAANPADSIPIQHTKAANDSRRAPHIGIAIEQMLDHQWVHLILRTARRLGFLEGNGGELGLGHWCWRK